jgi:hypothetical protein
MKRKVATKTENLVALANGVELDQPCLFGERVDTHAVYCNNSKSDSRKCHHSWYYGRATSMLDGINDEQCKWFQANPKYREDKNKLQQEIEEIKKQRQVDKDQERICLKEGYLCPNCADCFGYNAETKRVLCNLGTLVVGVVKIHDGKYSDEEVDKHFELDPMDVPMQKDSCPCFRVIER